MVGTIVPIGNRERLAGLRRLSLGLHSAGCATGGAMFGAGLSLLGDNLQCVGMMTGSHDLLQAIGVPILAGRALTSTDPFARPMPAVVTVSMARALWPSKDPLGRVVSLGVTHGS